MRANRLDKHHKAVVHCLRVLGASVQDLTRQKDDCPDLLVGYHGVDGTIEIKTGKKQPTGGQIQWHLNWLGRPVVVLQVPDHYTEQEILGLCEAILENWYV